MKPSLIPLLLLIFCGSLPHNLHAQSDSSPADTSDFSAVRWRATSFSVGMLMPGNSLALSDGLSLGSSYSIGLAPIGAFTMDYQGSFLVDTLGNQGVFHLLGVGVGFDLLTKARGIGVLLGMGAGGAWYRQAEIQEQGQFYRFSGGIRTRFTEHLGTRFEVNRIQLLSFSQAEEATWSISWGLMFYL